MLSGWIGDFFELLFLKNEKKLQRKDKNKLYRKRMKRYLDLSYLLK